MTFDIHAYDSSSSAGSVPKNVQSQLYRILHFLLKKCGVFCWLCFFHVHMKCGLQWSIFYTINYVWKDMHLATYKSIILL